jgi:hypothetical protein
MYLFLHLHFFTLHKINFHNFTSTRLVFYTYEDGYIRHLHTQHRCGPAPRLSLRDPSLNFNTCWLHLAPKRLQVKIWVWVHPIIMFTSHLPGYTRGGKLHHFLLLECESLLFQTWRKEAYAFGPKILDTINTLTEHAIW